MAWLPLSAIALPTMEASVIFLGFLGAFFPVVMNTYLGVISLPVNYRHAALSLGASPNHIFRRIILPGATPSVFTGMAVGIGMTWEMVAAAEMIAASEGLGYMVWDAYWLLAYPRILGKITPFLLPNYRFGDTPRIKTSCEVLKADRLTDTSPHP
jgi:NitT/TauT family transport system permease protein